MFAVDTKYPLAVDSPDYQHPYGARKDNTRNLFFNSRLLEIIPDHPISVLDLGCAGGGMVESFLEMKQIAVGIEGSDYSKRKQRAAWATIPDNLFLADATKPFIIHNGSDRAYQFDAVTGWEFFEHISESNLPGVIENITRHLKPGGLVFGTTTDKDYIRLNLHYHQTLKSMEWWIDYFSKYDIYYDRDLAFSFRNSWLRNGKFKLAMRYTPKEQYEQKDIN